MRRYGMVSLLLAVVLVGAGCGASSVKIPLPELIRKPSIEEQLIRVAGAVDQRFEVKNGWVVLSPAENGQRLLSYVVPTGDGWKLQGRPAPIAADAQVRLEGDLVLAESKKEGVPQITAFQLTVDDSGLDVVDFYRLRAPEPTVKTGHFVLVNKMHNKLYHYQDGRIVSVYAVATGRQTQPPTPTWEDYRTNFFTPEGMFTLTTFTENPSYNALKPGDKSFPGGDPGNPLGTRWMGFGVLDGDNGGVWGIHGTSEPDLIGTWASDGCIRMYTKDAEALFAVIKGKNARLQIVGK